MKKLNKVLLLGSGGLSIGQAGEFDYSGTQAVKSLLEEGLEVIVVNPNIATVQTTPRQGTRVYLYPVEPHWVERVIEIEKPDGIIAGFGGQTALSCAIKLAEQGILEKHGVLNLGTDIDTLRLTEDRDLFARKMTSLGIPIPPSFAATTPEEAVRAAGKISYPVIVRAAFALGGLGSGFAQNDAELKDLVGSALSYSPQVLVEKSLLGWKEVEYEVMRDSFGNAIAICNMENFDPLGIHTGDSIVVAPSQTLDDSEYQLLRSTALKIVQNLKIVGECNVQFALNPQSHEFYVIEINARLSRSSALASKATGYPIATIAAKVVLGQSLLEIKNPINPTTRSYFEPALDYVTVKIPRWDLQKFKCVSRKIGTTMKSVGEVMGIGRSFTEALQKAVRMVTEDDAGLSADRLIPRDATGREASFEEMKQATDTRLFQIMDALRNRVKIDEIYQLTHIDLWFLKQLSILVALEKEVEDFARHTQEKLRAQPSSFIDLLKSVFAPASSDQWQNWKRNGFGDEQLARIALRAMKMNPSNLSKLEMNCAMQAIRELRHEKGIHPVRKRIDTSAAEFPSHSNYLYLTYHGEKNDTIESDHKLKSALALGSGAYRIGSSVEFDWCLVNCLEELRDAGWRSVVINCNPETVSTDHDASDLLYFEELSVERILDIIDLEKVDGTLVAMGGQLPNRLSPALAQAGVKILGHDWDSIDRAEDREKFSLLLDQLKVKQPKWIEATSLEAVKRFIEEVGFPVLIRPSYVLSGAAMNVSVDYESLDYFMSRAKAVSQEHPVILTQYLEDALEVELDGVAQKGEILTSLVSSHVEKAGVHSGDATLVFPPQGISTDIEKKIRGIGAQLSQALNLNGPFNIQFLVSGDEILVIECNVRAARSFPFVSKVSKINLARLATRVMIGLESHSDLLEAGSEVRTESRIGVKASMFSFQRLLGADPVLGVEMASTGEVACIGRTFESALIPAFEATSIGRPKKGALLSAGRADEKEKLIPAVIHLKKLGIPIFATSGTADFLIQREFSVTKIEWDHIEEQVIRLIQLGQVDFIINLPKNYTRTELENGYLIRTAAIRHGCTLLTNVEKANTFLQALVKEPIHELIPL